MAVKEFSTNVHLCECGVCYRSFLSYYGDKADRCPECVRRGYMTKADRMRALQLEIDDRRRLFLNKVDRRNSLWGIESKPKDKSKATFDHKDICTITEFDRTTQDGRLVHVEWRH